MQDRGILWESFAEHVTHLKMSGSSNAVGRCPFHEDRSPSFAFNIYTGKWLCYAGSCGLRGDYSDFLELVGKSPEEIQALIEPVADEIKRQKEKDKLVWQTRYYNDPFLGEYVLPEPILGVYDYMPTDLRKAGFSAHTLRKFDVGYDREKDRIIFPIRDLYGNLVGVSGRTTKAEMPRYKVYLRDDFGPGFADVYPDYKIHSHNYLWNSHRAIAEVDAVDTPLIVTEGFKACMWVVQCGYENTVALMGSMISRNQADVIRRLANPIILFLDNDKAGREGTKKIAEVLARSSMKVYVAMYEEWMDRSFQPDTLSIKAIRKAITTAMRWRTWVTLVSQRNMDDH